jgi:hypothetical protein
MGFFDFKYLFEKMRSKKSKVKMRPLLTYATPFNLFRLRQSILKKAFSGKLVSIESDEDGREYLAEIVT